MHNYYETLESGDLRNLLILDTTEDLPEVNCDHLADVWEDIRTEVKQLTIDKSKQCEVAYNVERKIEIAKSDYDTIQVLLYRMWNVKEPVYIDALAELGYKINDKRDYHLELKRIEKQSKMLLTKIKVWQDDPIFKQGGGKSTIHDEISHIERHIGQIGSIDMHNMTMIKWLTMKFNVSSELAKNKK